MCMIEELLQFSMNVEDIEHSHAKVVLQSFKLEVMC